MRTGREAIEFFFGLSLYLFVATGFVAVAATGKLDVPSVILVGAALGLRGLAFLGLTRISLTPSAVTRLTVAYMFFYVADYFLLSGSFVTATGHLVFFVLVVKLFSARVNRDFLYLAVIGFMEMLLAAIMTIDATFLGLFSLFLVFGIATFASFEIRRAYAGGQTSQIAEVRVQPAGMLRSLAITSTLVAAGVVVLAGLLFFVIPRYTTGYLSGLAPKSEHISGFSDNVALGEIGNIKQSSVVVMHVRLNSGNPDLSILRWRGVGLVIFDGLRWSNPGGSVVLAGWTVPGSAERRFYLRRPLSPFSQPDRQLSYTVLLEPISNEALFLAPSALSVTGRFRMLEMDSTESVLRRDLSYSTMRYDAVSDTRTPGPEQLRSAPQDYPREIADRYLQLPRMDPRVRQLAEDITRSTPTAYDKAAALETYLRTRYGYTLEMASSGPDPVADFLFNVRRGHCEYFASAMAIMLRSLGIPARLVNGFLPGEYNDISQQYVVRGRDAHTWVEVYFPGYEWVTFDPTPAAGTVSSASLGRLSLWLDAMHVFWTDWVVSYDFSRQFLLARQMDRSARRASVETQSYFRSRYRSLRLRIQALHQRLREHRAALPALIMAVFAGMLVLMFWQRLVLGWQQAVSRSRVRSGRAGRRDATVAYERLLDFLARRGFERTPAMTPRELAEEVSDPALKPVVAEFTAVYEEARFGGATTRLPELYALLARARRRKFETAEGRR